MDFDILRHIAESLFARADFMASSLVVAGLLTTSGGSHLQVSSPVLGRGECGQRVSCLDAVKELEQGEIRSRLCDGIECGFVFGVVEDPALLRFLPPVNKEALVLGCVVCPLGLSIHLCVTRGSECHTDFEMHSWPSSSLLPSLNPSSPHPQNHSKRIKVQLVVPAPSSVVPSHHATQRSSTHLPFLQKDTFPSPSPSPSASASASPLALPYPNPTQTSSVKLPNTRTSHQPSKDLQTRMEMAFSKVFQPVKSPLPPNLPQMPVHYTLVETASLPLQCLVNLPYQCSRTTTCVLLLQDLNLVGGLKKFGEGLQSHREDYGSIRRVPNECQVLECTCHTINVVVTSGMVGKTTVRSYLYDSRYFSKPGQSLNGGSANSGTRDRTSAKSRHSSYENAWYDSFDIVGS